MSGQSSFDEVMREGERQGYFVEMLTLERDGIEYEVPKVFYDDLMEKIGENHDLTRIICEAVAHGVYEQNNKYWNQMVEIWQKAGKPSCGIWDALTAVPTEGAK